MSKYKFHADEWFEIKGRGPCAIIEKHDPDGNYWWDRYPELYDPCLLTGQEVEINGKAYRVNGVETFAIGRSKESPYKLGFSLCVNEPDLAKR